MSKPVQEVIEELVQENYLGGITGIAVLFVNTEGEIEVKIGFKSDVAYKIITAMRVLEFNMLQDINNNAARTPKQRD